MVLSLDTRCDFCGHKRSAHEQQGNNVVKFHSGPCHGSGGVCQCAEFERPLHEGSDIQDVPRNATEAQAIMEAANNILDGGKRPSEGDVRKEQDFPGLDEDYIYHNGHWRTLREYLEAKQNQNIDAQSLPEDARIIAVNQPPESATPDGIYSLGTPVHISNKEQAQIVPGSGRKPKFGDVWLARERIWSGTVWLTYEEWEKQSAGAGYSVSGRDAVSYNELNGISQEAPQNDPVHHPSHYTAYPGIEVIQLTRWMGFNKGNAVKYIARAGLKDKDKEIQDLEKAIWYLQDEIKMKKGEYGTT